MGIDPSEAEDHVCPEGAPAWLATMGDLMSNLLVFFVLLLSFANTDRQVFQQTMESIQTYLGVIGTSSSQSFGADSLIEWQKTPSSPCEVTRMDQPNPTPTMDQKIMQKVQQTIASNGLSRVVVAESSERGVSVRVTGNALFKPGSDLLLPISFVFLDEIVRIAQEFPYELSIEGHTDDSSVDSTEFPTNWHLSMARSIAVLRYMIDRGKIDPGRIVPSGFGSTRPLFPNDSPEHRAANRRVEFVFKRDPIVDRAKRAERRAAARADRESERR